jgi:hypothetical protein
VRQEHYRSTEGGMKVSTIDSETRGDAGLDAASRRLALPSSRMKQEETCTQGKELKEQSSSSWSGGVKVEVEANPFRTSLVRSAGIVDTTAEPGTYPTTLVRGRDAALARIPLDRSSPERQSSSSNRLALLGNKGCFSDFRRGWEKARGDRKHVKATLAVSCTSRNWWSEVA